MKEGVKRYFLKPYLIQVCVMVFVVVPPDTVFHEGAMRSASIMPVAEGMGVFVMWAVLTAMFTVIPMYLKTFLPLADALFIANVDLMCGINSIEEGT